MRCQAGSDSEVVSYCERKQSLQQLKIGEMENGINPTHCINFKKSMSLDEVRERLIELGFVDKK